MSHKQDKRCTPIVWLGQETLVQNDGAVGSKHHGEHWIRDLTQMDGKGLWDEIDLVKST